MYADRYAPRRVNRGSLSLSVGIAGSLVAAAMLASPVVKHLVPDKPFIGYPVRVDPPPPPEPQTRMPPKAKPAPSPRIDQPSVLVPTEPKAPYEMPPTPPGPINPGPGDGTGTSTVIADPPKPPSVLTTPTIDERFARDFQPAYPAAEQRAGRDGLVTLKVRIGTDGRVLEAVQIAAASEDFWRVTLRQALSKWRFKPATRDGSPIEAWRTMTVRFRLEE